MRKNDSKELCNRFSISPSTIRKLEKFDSTFPKPEIHGLKKYYSGDELTEWLENRASNPGAITPDTQLITKNEMLRLIGRTAPWLHANKDKFDLARVNLAPDINSKNPRVYFLLNEVEKEFADLIAINNQRHAFVTGQPVAAVQGGA